MDKQVYINKGYESRYEYLETLSEETGVPLDVVKECAFILGPSEDFDGLPSMLDDWILENY